MNRYAALMGICCVIALILLPLSWYLRFIPGIVIAALFYALGIYFALKADKIKKQYDVQTYREVVAFSKGETLDEIAKIRESGKRKYQKFLLAAGGGVLAIIVSLIIVWILRGF